MIRRSKSRPPRRPGFTLIELLVVIVIIGILVGLLLPAIMAAVRRANDAQISADIQTLAAALVQFKDKYGEYPPSRVILSETGVYSNSVTHSPQGSIVVPQTSDYTTALSSVTAWYGTVNAGDFGSDDVSFGTLAERSVRAIRKYFPRATPPSSSTSFHDFNGNNVMDTGFILLQGDECLAFFLGGIPSPTATASGQSSFGMSGFGRNPQFPFVNNAVSTNRTPPLFEFKADRLLDVYDGDGIPGYMDPSGTGVDARPYAYFASYGAAGYDPNDCNFAPGGANELSPSGGTAGTQFQMGTPILPSASTFKNMTSSPAPNPYTSSFSVPISGGAFAPGQPAAYLNPISYQIISAGADRLYGPGGQFLGGTSDKIVIPPSPFTIPQGDRDPERDNVTSFAQGRLD